MIVTDTENFSPVFGKKQMRKQEHLKKYQENENGSLIKLVDDSNNVCLENEGK